MTKTKHTQETFNTIFDYVQNDSGDPFDAFVDYLFLETILWTKTHYNQYKIQINKLSAKNKISHISFYNLFNPKRWAEQNFLLFSMLSKFENQVSMKQSIVELYLPTVSRKQAYQRIVRIELIRTIQQDCSLPT